MKIHTIQALFGDCFVLEFGKNNDKHFILIDGGPKTVYADYLRPFLKRISKNGNNLDLVVLSHVDEDHVYGLIDLMNELTTQKINYEKPLIEIKQIWQNSFDLTIGFRNNVASTLNTIVSKSHSKFSLMNWRN